MQTTPAPLDSLLLTIVLAILAVGLPILIILAVRFFWDRSLILGRSKELEKLVWQLHRIASALEHQMNLFYPSVQPGTEDATDLAYLQRPSSPSPVAPTRAAPPQTSAPVPANAAPAAANATPTPAASALPPPPAQPLQSAPSEQAAESSGFPPLKPRDPNQPAPHGGVNSMFGL